MEEIEGICLDVDEFLSKSNSAKSQGLTEIELADIFGMSVKQFRKVYNFCINLKNNVRR